MLPKWESRLGGAQEFMPTHCFAMTEFGLLLQIRSSVQSSLTVNFLIFTAPYPYLIEVIYPLESIDVLAKRGCYS